MDKELLNLAAESVFCSEPMKIRLAESSTPYIPLALAGLAGSAFGFLWYAMFGQKSGLPKWAGASIPLGAMTAAYVGVKTNEDSKAEEFAAAYDMKCNQCVDDERCFTLYGPGFECVDAECMEISDEEEDEDE